MATLPMPIGATTVVEEMAGEEMTQVVVAVEVETATKIIAIAKARKQDLFLK